MGTDTETVTTLHAVDCNERWCIGGHDQDDDCIGAYECDPRCLGHWGKPTDCAICPEPRCAAHSEDDHDLCEELHCTGHEWDGEELTCIDGHAAWCTGEGFCIGGNRGSCEIKLGYGLHLTTELSDGTTTLDGSDLNLTKDEDFDGALTALAKGREYMAMETAYIAGHNAR